MAALYKNGTELQRWERTLDRDEYTHYSILSVRSNGKILEKSVFHPTSDKRPTGAWKVYGRYKNIDRVGRALTSRGYSEVAR